MSELEVDVLVLLDRIDTARTTGSTERELVDLVLRSGWRPIVAGEREEVLDGVLASGVHVPIRIVRAA